MIRERYPWLTDKQFRLCEVADRAWDKANLAARIVCGSIDRLGLHDPSVRERFSEWKLADEEYQRAIDAAEKSRQITNKATE